MSLTIMNHNHSYVGHHACLTVSVFLFSRQTLCGIAAYLHVLPQLNRQLPRLHRFTVQGFMIFSDVFLNDLKHLWKREGLKLEN